MSLQDSHLRMPKGFGVEVILQIHFIELEYEYQESKLFTTV
jgi:hypothetical protein